MSIGQIFSQKKRESTEKEREREGREKKSEEKQHTNRPSEAFCAKKKNNDRHGNDENDALYNCTNYI